MPLNMVADGCGSHLASLGLSQPSWMMGEVGPMTLVLMLQGEARSH